MKRITITLTLLVTLSLACSLGGLTGGGSSPGENDVETLAANCRPTRPVPVVAFHGTADQILPNV